MREVVDFGTRGNAANAWGCARFKLREREGSVHYALALERVVPWPLARGNATRIVPAIEWRWRPGCPSWAPHCPHCDGVAAVYVVTRDFGERVAERWGRRFSGEWSFGEVCGLRPLEATCDYDESCERCGHAIAWHGIMGVSFCAACGGPLRGLNEMQIFDPGSGLFRERR